MKNNKRMQSNEQNTDILNGQLSSSTATVNPEDNDREEGEIIDDYEDIISSEEEFSLRQRIEELEARNLELEKIAAISSLKSTEYECFNKDLGGAKTTYINLVDDDNSDDIHVVNKGHHYTNHYHMQSNKSQAKKSSRREKSRLQKHERKKKCRKHRYVKAARKPHRNVRKRSEGFSSEEEFVLDREKLKAALKRETTTSATTIPTISRSSNNCVTSLKRKLQGVKQSISTFIDHNAQKSDGKDDIFNDEILELLDDLTNERTATYGVMETISDIENESISLEEQELRLIALKSAIVKKHEARRKRKVNEQQRPYSPTDTDIIMDVSRCSSVQPLGNKDELDNMEISPLNSPTSCDKILLPIDMELVSSDSCAEPIFFSEDSTTKQFPTNWIPVQEIPLPLETNLSAFNLFNPVKETNLIDNTIITPTNLIEIQYSNNLNNSTNHSMTTIIEKTQMEKDAELLQEEEENALRALLLANMNSPKTRNRNQSSAIISPSIRTRADYTPDNVPFDPNVEADEIRKSLLLNFHKKTTFDVIDVRQKENREINLPKIAMNLKDAVKRIKHKYHITKTNSNRPSNYKRSNSNLIIIDLNKNTDVDYLEEVVSDSHKLNNIGAAIMNNNEENLQQLQIIEKYEQFHLPEAENKLISKIAKKNPETFNQQLTLYEVKSPAQSNLIQSSPIKIIQNSKVSESNQTKLNLKKPVPTSNPTSNLKRVQQQPKPTEIPLELQPKRHKKQHIITTMPIKPVNRLIIELRPSDSDSDDERLFIDETQITDVENFLLSNICTEADRINDNASPSSIAMDSPSFSPSSPVHQMSLHRSGTSAGNDECKMDNTDVSIVPPTPILQNDFQKKLDEFLKSARSKVENTANNNHMSRIQLDPLVSKPVTPLAVRHLPASAQLEYRQLVNRMSLLEKQKNLKLHALVNAQKSLKKKVLVKTSCSVPIENNNSTTATTNTTTASANNKLDDVKITLNHNGRIVQQTKPHSLMKQVLVKNVSIKVQNETEEPKQQQHQCDFESEINVTENTLLLSNLAHQTEIVQNTQDIRTINKKNDELMENMAKIDENINSAENNSTYKKEFDSMESIEQTATETSTTISSFSKSSATPLLLTKIFNGGTNVQKTKSNLMISLGGGKRLSFAHIKQLSMKKKLNALQSVEMEYNQHSTIFLKDLDKLCKLLNIAQITKQKQITMEHELEMLRAKMQQIEQNVNSQKSILSKLYPTISTSHKSVLHNRTKMFQLSSHCSKLGKFINGNSYSIPNDVKDVIIQKLKKIWMETKSLKNIKKFAVDSIVKNIDANEMQRDQYLETQTITDATVTTTNNHNTIENEVTNELTPFSENIFENKTENSATNVMQKSTNTETIEIFNKETQYELEDMTSINDLSAMVSIKKYQSPLDHMQNKSSNNPNAILCPFQLMGQCEDKECHYEHLRT